MEYTREYIRTKRAAGLSREDVLNTFKVSSVYLAQFGAIGINIFSKLLPNSVNLNTTLSYFNVFLLFLDLGTYLES